MMVFILGTSNIIASNDEDGFSATAFKHTSEIVLSPLGGLSEVEMNAVTSISPWVFPVHTLDIVDSYMPFIFRTKKSAAIDELKVIISINDKGKISGYEVLNEKVDKGLVERIGHVVRNMPRAVPIPGFDRYEAMDFELVIRK